MSEEAPSRYVLPSAVVPVSYRLEITPDLVGLDFRGSEDIDVVVSESVDCITLHAKELSVTAVTYSSAARGGDSRPLPALEIAYHVVDTTVRFTFGEKLPVGEGVLHVEFSGILNGDMAGFYRSSYCDADGKTLVMGSTQFEALDARRAFPCWDEPAVKACFSLSLVVDADLTALSNMNDVKSQFLPGGKRRVVFAASPKMSTYLLAWAVGKFDCIQTRTTHGVLIRIFSPPGQAERGRFALACGVRSLDFFDDYFQVPYPLPKLDMLCCTEFACGAMENWGLVTYREVDLMVDEQKASSQQRQRVAIIIAHELAHQWFGNLVTMQWWNDLWLNEGFASFMEHLTVDALFPSWNIWEQFTTDAMGAALRLDALRSSHPIQVPIFRAEEVEQVFDAISYCKGSTVIRMAASVLGPAHFRKGLQIYMDRHKYSNTVTDDLWNAWSEASGIDLPALMQSWTKQMGYPYLTVRAEAYNAATASLDIELEQNWFLADGSCTPEEAASKLWAIPLIFGTPASVSDTVAVMDSRRQTFSVPVSGPGDWVKVNAGQQSMVRVAYTPAMSARLLPAIRAKAVLPVDRAALLLDAYALAKAGLGSAEAVVRYLSSFGDEDNATVWTAVAGVLSGLSSMMEDIGGEAHGQFKAMAGSMVKRALDRTGWDEKATDGHVDKLLRTTIVGLLDEFCSEDTEVLAEARRRFDEHWEEPSVLPSDYKTTIYKLILKSSATSVEYDRILQTFYDTNDNTERKFAMNSLGASKSRYMPYILYDICSVLSL
jgi:puromycin-sensitive aminopeptidase